MVDTQHGDIVNRQRDDRRGGEDPGHRQQCDTTAGYRSYYQGARADDQHARCGGASKGLAACTVLLLQRLALFLERPRIGAGRVG